MAISSDQQFVRSAEVADRVIGGERLLIPVRHDASQPAQIMSLNRVGSAIWDALEKPRSFAAVVAAVLERFEVTDDVARADAEEFVVRLLALGLLTEVRG